MNVLMLSGDVVTAQGAHGVFYETLRLLSRHWARIDVVCPGTPQASARVVHGNAFVHPSRWHKGLQALSAIRTGGALMRERRYDLIVSHDYSIFSNGIAAWWLSRRFGVPYVSEMHHIEGYPRAANRKEAVYRRLAALYAPFAGRHAAAIRTVNAQEVPEFLRRRGVPEEKIVVLPSLYIDLEVFVPVADAERRYDVLCVGRLVGNKNFSMVVDAVARCRDAGRPLRFCILGDGPLRAELCAQIDRLGLKRQVTMIDRLAGAEDIAALYVASAMLVCVSTSEGGPRVTVEAMACGVPVVTTPVGIMRELVRDGENALLVGWDAAELADRMVELLDDRSLSARIGAAGRDSVASFRAELAIDRLVATYAALARQAA